MYLGKLGLTVLGSSSLFSEHLQKAFFRVCRGPHVQDSNTGGLVDGRHWISPDLPGEREKFHIHLNGMSRHGLLIYYYLTISRLLYSAGYPTYGFCLIIDSGNIRRFLEHVSGFCNIMLDKVIFFLSFLITGK